MPSENMLQSEAFWLVLGVIVGVLGAHRNAEKDLGFDPAKGLVAGCGKGR